VGEAHVDVVTHSRPYGAETDYEQMRELLIESFAVAGPPDYCSVGELDWLRYTTGDTPDAATSARLWFTTSGELAGFAWPGQRQVDLLVRPRYRARALEGDMLAWAEDERRGRGGEPLTLTAWAYEGDRERAVLLQDRGYTRTATALAYNVREVVTPLPVVALPPGHAVRHVLGEADVERRVAVHRDAFAPSRMTVAKHRAVMGAPTYRADLDLVVVAPDGMFAAYCLVWYDTANRHGEFEPVGCHSAHRRRGLGKAVMAEGLRRLAALGARTAAVNSLYGAVPANRLYRSVGFRPLDLNYAWEKRL
jgi:mycothiol synthase